MATPDYARATLDRLIAESRTWLVQLGLDVTSAAPVIVWDNFEPATSLARAACPDAIIALLVSWVEPPLLVAALRPFRDTPLILWSHTTFVEGGTRLTLGALPAAGVVRETLEQMAFRFRFVYGMPTDPCLAEQIPTSARAAAVERRLAQARIGLFGYAAMGIYTGTVDHVKLRSRLGPEIVHQGQSVIVDRFAQIGDDAVADLLPRAHGWDVERAVEPATMQRMFRLYAAIKVLAQEGRYDALTVKCQYELSRAFGFAPCVPLSMLADEMVVSCEGDVLAVVTQLILHLLSGGPASYGDLHHVDERSIWLGACGFAPFDFAAGQPAIRQHTALYDGLCNSSPTVRVW